MEQQKIIKGKKLNMSQIFTSEGKVIPVTIVRLDEELVDDIMDLSIVLIGTSKGKGFTGVMKKWNFKGSMATRGQSNKPRAPGSIGGQTPGRVFKGKKMAGRMGNIKVTLKNLKIVNVDVAKREVMVSGPIPGARNSEVCIKLLS